MVIVFKSKRLAQVFGAIVLFLVSASIVIQTVRFSTGDHRVFGLVSFLSLGAENNLPTFYATFAVLFCAFLLMLIGYLAWHSERQWSGYWIFLALVFAFLSLDESVQLHEHLIDPMRSLFGADGFFYYAWVIPYGIGLVVFAAAYLRFLLHIPRRSAVLFIVAGSLFVTGAIGFEMIGGYVYQEAGGSLNVLYVVVQSIEEILEMTGIVVFLYALADYIEKSFGELQLVIKRD